MSKRLSVGNLPHHMTGEELQTLFSEAGLVVASARTITYLHNGQSCGFGYVEMKTMAESQKAVDLLNGRQVDGRLIVVKPDRLRSKSVFGRRSRN